MGIDRYLRELPRRYGRVTSSGTYVPQIDGLRFLAILQVMIYHASFRGVRAVVPVGEAMQGIYAYLPNGVAGVELFFFISGYIISYPFLAGRAPKLSAFYMRRVYRLEPPYLLVLFLCFLVLNWGAYNVGTAPQFAKSDVPLPLSFLASCFYLHGLLFQAPPRLNPPLWSLELEIQFYLLAPFLLMLYGKVSSYRRRTWLGVGLTLLALVGQVALGRVLPYWHFTIFGNCYAFLLGMVVCDAAVRNDPFKLPSDRHHDLLFAIGVVLFLLSAVLWLPWRGQFLADITVLLMRAGGIVLLYKGASRGTVARRLLAMPWLTLLGGACYSLYLVHVPLMQAVGNVVFHHVPVQQHVVVAACLALIVLIPPAMVAGLIYYVFIERPCMEHRWPMKLLARMHAATAR